MVKLVSLTQASEHLRRDTDDDNADLDIKIQAASLAVLNYIADHSFLDSSGKPDLDSSLEPIVPAPIQAATLILVGMLYKERDGEAFEERTTSIERLGQITLPRTVHFLLDPYRSPVLQ